MPIAVHVDFQAYLTEAAQPHMYSASRLRECELL